MSFDKADYAKKSKARNRAFVVAYKLEHGCTDCGYRAHVDALEFDHIPGRGKKVHNMNQAAFSTRGLESLAREMAKCEVVCANCHRVRTANRRHGRSN